MQQEAAIAVSSPLLKEVVSLALEAGRAIMDVYVNGTDARLKADNSPVTDADLAAERIILEGLERIAPEIPVVSEEACSEGAKPVAAEKFFLVDPLDGTREFLNRNGEFTVNIALIERGRPVLGVVYAPALDRLFGGERGIGAYASAGSRSRRIGVRQVPAVGLVAVASRSHRDAETERWLASQRIASLISAGSSLKFCLIAAGKADVYPRFGRTMEWDTAAGHAVLAAAGGEVFTTDGSPLAYGKSEQGFANPAFIAKSKVTFA